MGSQICEMPEKCSECGLLFDLSYDLEGACINEVMEVKVLSGLPLCWHCRGVQA